MLKMRFDSFVWPNNPRTYTLSCKRQTAVHKIPMGGFAVQDLGRTATVMQGEGEFFGAGAYDTFQELLSVFQKGGQQMLVHPVWQTASAYFTELTLTQEPRDDYVAYRFTTLWEICTAYRLSMQALLRLNPQIAKPNSVAAGTRVRVQ